MLVPPQHEALYFIILEKLFEFARKKLHRKESVNQIRDNSYLSYEILRQVWQHPDWLDEMIKKTRNLAPIEKEVIQGFKKAIIGRFIVVEHLDTGSIVIDERDHKVYLIKGLSKTIPEMVFYRDLPVQIVTNLIPLMDDITYDSNMGVDFISFSQAEKDAWQKIYQQAKRDGTIIKSL